MNVLLVSQCRKNALKQTRRILDQFAERRGERTWQTPITKAGLDTLRKLLRASARKNTAVACHWIRGHDHSELLWIVGDASQFNARGAAPTNTTRRNILRTEDENDWHSGEDIRLLAMMAGLLHDLGKASQAFQWRLAGRLRERNRYRHEWVSLRLFQAFVGNDDDEGWLKRLQAQEYDDSTWTRPAEYQRDGLDASDPYPFRKLPPLARALGWLVLTHHRLPVAPAFQEDRQLWLGARARSFNPDWLLAPLDPVAHDWNEIFTPGNDKDIAPYWQVAGALPASGEVWRTKAARLARRLFELRQQRGDDWLERPFVMHLARLSLMLADHNYSSLSLDENDAPVDARRKFLHPHARLIANTTRNRSGQSVDNQTLDEHLLGVAHHAGQIAHALPSLERELPRLARHRGLRKRSGAGKFSWQDKAFDTALGIRDSAREKGAFIVNMASTGCGKTLANARLLYALSDPERGMRATFALGLRALTHQTGRSYRADLKLSKDELAVRVGGGASRALFAYHERQAAERGSASTQALIEEDDYVLFEGATEQGSLLSWVGHDQKARSLLMAPMLVCTVDHLVPATESLRGGRQIAPMLRLMSADLVLDELDDYDLADLPALARLMQWAGMLGTRVVLSSATLPPALVEGMFLAYQAGRCEYRRHRGAGGGSTIEQADIPCIWTDEFGTRHETCWSRTGFTEAHACFIQRRVTRLGQADPLRRAALWPLTIADNQNRETIRSEFADHVLQAARQLHADHAQVDPTSDKKISFGLVRMANIDPLFDVAKALFEQGAPENTRIHLCVYHARFPLIQRSAIERQLDTALNRRDENAVFQLPAIREALDANHEPNHLFVVIASPVCEVGRDWDADWAIAEPSSMRSLIQLAGRVQRHRQRLNDKPNILIFDTNLRHFSRDKGPDGKPGAIFVRPGFEKARAPARHPFRLVAHRLSKLMEESEYRTLTALPRIAPRPKTHWQPKIRLTDLEQARMANTMLPLPAEDAEGLNAASGWQHPRAMLTGVLAQQQPFRESTIPSTKLVLLPQDEEAPETLLLHRIESDPEQRGEQLYVLVEQNQRHDVALHSGPRIAPWGNFDLPDLLQEQAEDQSLTPMEAARRFSQLEAPEHSRGWRYHPWLGFSIWRP